MSFGNAISNARKQQGIQQKDLAGEIEKEDGSSISPQYLSDIEHDRRTPSSDHLIKQLADRLRIDADYLYHLAGRLPEDVRQEEPDPETVRRAYDALRDALNDR